MGETLRRLREYCAKLPNQAEAAAERCIQVSFVRCCSDDFFSVEKMLSWRLTHFALLIIGQAMRIKRCSDINLPLFKLSKSVDADLFVIVDKSARMPVVRITSYYFSWCTLWSDQLLVCGSYVCPLI